MKKRLIALTLILLCLPGTGIAGDFGWIPRLIDDVVPENLGPAQPRAGNGVPPSAVMGADIAMAGDRIAYARNADDPPALHVLRRQNGALVFGSGIHGGSAHL